MSSDKKGTDTASGWVQSVAAAREVSAEELRRQAALFRPTPRQTLFRDVAEEQVNMGNMLQTRWLQVRRDTSLPPPPHSDACTAAVCGGSVKFTLAPV